MGCTTILVGKAASADGSALIARNEDSANGEWNPKRIVVVEPGDQPRHYTSVISRVEVDLPDAPLRYTAAPNAVLTEGVWGEAGINEANVAMSATETLTTNTRVLGADPFVERRGDQPGGIGEEDFLTLVLPYIRSAREGVLRLGALLERYGTYEMNGVAFSDVDEIWWLETVGGHHWIARRVPDDVYVTMPNQLGIDRFDLADAEGAGAEHLASADLRTFMLDNHLVLDSSFQHELDTFESRELRATIAVALNRNYEASASILFNPREAFGSHSDADHVYNTPRAWDMQRRLNPSTAGELSPESDTIPWARVPERKLTIEDVKDVLSGHYQGTPYDPYGTTGTAEQRRLYRPIGINRHSELSVLQIRPDRPASSRAIQWVAFASNPFNTLVPLYTNVERTPAYLEGTTATVSTDSLYWSARLIAALADAHFADAIPEVERYQEATLALGRRAVSTTDAQVAELDDDAQVREALAAANDDLAERIRQDTDALLGSVLVIASNGMRNRFSRSDH